MSEQLERTLNLTGSSRIGTFGEGGGEGVAESVHLEREGDQKKKNFKKYQNSTDVKDKPATVFLLFRTLTSLLM